MNATVSLKPNTQRLRQLIKEHGQEWKVLRGPERMACFNNSMGLYVESLSGPTHRRNVRLEDIEQI